MLPWRISLVTTRLLGLGEGGGMGAVGEGSDDDGKKEGEVWVDG